MVDSKKQAKLSFRNSADQLNLLCDPEIEQGMTADNFLRLRKERMSIAVSQIHEQRKSRFSIAISSHQPVDKQLQLDDVIKCFRMIV